MPHQILNNVRQRLGRAEHLTAAEARRLGLDLLAYADHLDEGRDKTRLVTRSEVLAELALLRAEAAELREALPI